MRDVYEVLREKEIRLEQLARELKALRLAAPLLIDGTDIGSELADAPDSRRESDAQGFRSEGRAGRGRLPVTKEGQERTAVSTAVSDEVRLAAKKISGRLKRLTTPLRNAVNPAS